MAIPGTKIGIFKILGLFGIILMLLIWIGPTLVGVGRAMKTGEWNAVLKETGGRIFAIDAILNEETNYLIDEENPDQLYTKIFHLSHALALLFMLFFLFFLLFRFGNWLIGIRSLSPSSDIFIIIFILLAFLLVEFLYAYIVLDMIIIPLKDGVFYFLVKLPAIVNGLIG